MWPFKKKIKNKTIYNFIAPDEVKKLCDLSFQIQKDWIKEQNRQKQINNIRRRRKHYSNF